MSSTLLTPSTTKSSLRKRCLKMGRRRKGVAAQSLTSLCCWRRDKTVASAVVTKSENGWGWQRLLEVILSKPPVQTGPSRAGCPGQCADSCWISPALECCTQSWPGLDCQREKEGKAQLVSYFFWITSWRILLDLMFHCCTTAWVVYPAESHFPQSL